MSKSLIKANSVSLRPAVATEITYKNHLVEDADVKKGTGRFLISKAPLTDLFYQIDIEKFFIQRSHRGVYVYTSEIASLVNLT